MSLQTVQYYSSTICRNCGREFRSIHALHTHEYYESHNLLIPSQCKYCKREFQGRNLLIGHLVNCSEKLRQKQLAKAYRDAKRVNKKISHLTYRQCEFCKQVFSGNVYSKHKVACRLAQPVTPFRGSVTLVNNDWFDNVVEISAYDFNDPGLAAYGVR